MARASQVVLSENEYYLIKAPNGKVLEVKDFSTANGAFIQLWDYAGHPWQQWRFVDAGEGRWRIQNRFTGKMIDLVQDGVVEGTWLHQWSRTSGLSQCWVLEPLRNGRTRIRSVLANKYIDLVGDITVRTAPHTDEAAYPHMPPPRRGQDDLVRKLNQSGKGRGSRKGSKA